MCCCSSEDGKDSIKFYTDPGYFFELWCEQMMAKEAGLQAKKQKQRNRKPVSISVCWCLPLCCCSYQSPCWLCVISYLLSTFLFCGFCLALSLYVVILRWFFRLVYFSLFLLLPSSTSTSETNFFE